ncbi:MAG TPA: efflux RND transporter periplasmic adaptor subunit [Steroidobacteraceae bacterium]|nr:efflux RND transporter periplasmic adaptor subunit [Steroidobacteraceae bacterium]
MRSAPRCTAPLALAALAAALASGGCSSEAGNAPAVTVSNVTLTAAQRGHIELLTLAPAHYRRTLETTAAVDFDNDQATAVLAPFSGPVSRLLVAQGDEVRKGQPLAQVDSPDFAAAVGAYRKAFATARTDRRLADQDQDLVQHNGVSEREFAQAQTDAANAEADRDAALRALIALGVPPEAIESIDQGRAVANPGGLIRSPVAGTVVEKLITPGELLQAGTTACFTVADLSRVWVMAHLFGADLAAVNVGDPAEVVTGVDAHDFAGKVDKIAALVDPDTRAVDVRVLVENPKRALRKGMYVRVLIHSRLESTGLLVPISAVLRDDENLPFVYAAQADGSFARRPITLGARVAEQYEVASGLAAGEKVVVSGGLFVQFMQSQ